MSSHTTTFGPRPATTAKFSKGKIAKITAHDTMLKTKTRREPKRLTKCEKKMSGKMPPMPPYKDNHNPMDAGLRSSPPYSTGVDHTSGMYDIATASRSASIA